MFIPQIQTYMASACEQEVRARLQATGLNNKNDLIEFITTMEHSADPSDRILYRHWKDTFVDFETHCVDLYLAPPSGNRKPASDAAAADQGAVFRAELQRAVDLYNTLKLSGDGPVTGGDVFDTVVRGLVSSLRAAVARVPPAARSTDDQLHNLCLWVEDLLRDGVEPQLDRLLQSTTARQPVSHRTEAAAMWMAAHPQAFSLWGDLTELRALLWRHTVNIANPVSDGTLPADWLCAEQLARGLRCAAAAADATVGVWSLLQAWLLHASASHGAADHPHGTADCAAFIARIAADGRCTPALLRELLRLEPAATHAVVAITDRPAVARIRDRDESAVDVDAVDAPPRQRARILAGDDLGQAAAHVEAAPTTTGLPPRQQEEGGGRGGRWQQEWMQHAADIQHQPQEVIVHARDIFRRVYEVHPLAGSRALVLVSLLYSRRYLQHPVDRMPPHQHDNDCSNEACLIGQLNIPTRALKKAFSFLGSVICPHSRVQMSTQLLVRAFRRPRPSPPPGAAAGVV